MMISLGATVAVAQISPSIRWERSLGGSGEDDAACIGKTRDGGYIVAGGSFSNDGDVTGHHGDTSTADGWIVKLDSTGALQWERSLGGSSDDWLFSVQQTYDGGYIAAGWTESNDGDVTGFHGRATGNHGGDDYWVVKLDSMGNLQWEKCYGGSGYERAYCIRQTRDSGYIIAGYTEGPADSDIVGSRFLNYSENCWIVKTDKNGAIQWQKVYGGNDPVATEATYIEQTSDGGYIFTGSASGNGGDVKGNKFNDAACWVVKLNSTDSIEWAKCYVDSGSPDHGNGNCIHQTADGGYIVTVYPFMKLDDTGAVTWQVLDQQEGPNVRQTSDGEYIVASMCGGCPGVHGGNSEDYWSMKFDGNGVFQWGESLGGSGYDGFDIGEHSYVYVYTSVDIQQTNDGSYVMAGSSDSHDGDVTGNHGNFDYWVVKFGPPEPGILTIQSDSLPALVCGAQEYDTLYVHNTGTGELAISSAILSDTINFTLVSPSSFPGTVGPHDSLQFIFRFHPTAAGTVIDSLNIFNNDTISGHNPWRIIFTGTKDSSGFSVQGAAGDTLNFGSLACGAQKDTTIDITNHSTKADSIVLRSSTSSYTFPSPERIGAGGQLTITVHFAGGAPGVYTDSLLMADACGETQVVYLKAGVDSVHVSVAAQPSVTVCAGDSVTLTATGGYASYKWTTGETTPRIVVKTSGSYAVTVTTSGGCSATSPPVTVTVSDTLAPVITGPVGFCQGGSITLDAGSGYDAYRWTENGKPGGTTETITIDSPGVFSVAVTKGGCAGTSGDVAVRQYPLPDATIAASGALAFCAGDSVIISAPAGLSSYLWSTGATTQRIVVKAAGTYSVTVTDSNGCSNTSSPVITSITPVPNITVSRFFAQTICPMASTTIHIPVTNSDTLARVLTFTDSNCTLSQTTATLAAGATDTLAATFAGGAAGTYTCTVHVMDDCGGVHDVTLTINVQSLPPLALALVPDATPVKVGGEVKIYVTATPPSSVAGTLSFTVGNDAQILRFDSVHTPCGFISKTSPGSTVVTLGNCPILTSDTLATLYYEALAGPTLTTSAEIVTAATTNACQTVSASGAAMLTLLPPSCDIGTIGIEPQATSLGAVYPNPATGAVTIAYTMVEDAPVRIALADALGRTVEILVDGWQKHGSYLAEFDAHGLPNGAYVITMQEGLYKGAREVFVVK